jgi:hypothetical protein
MIETVSTAQGVEVVIQVEDRMDPEVVVVTMEVEEVMEVVAVVDTAIETILQDETSPLRPPPQGLTSHTAQRRKGTLTTVYLLEIFHLIVLRMKSKAFLMASSKLSEQILSPTEVDLVEWPRLSLHRRTM